MNTNESDKSVVTETIIWLEAQAKANFAAYADLGNQYYLGAARAFVEARHHLIREEQ